MSQVDFQMFDADNHYYEATDAFTRYQDPKMAKRCVQWATIDGRLRLLVGGRVCRFIPNPTFDPVARPGALDAYFRGQMAGEDIREAFGDLDPISPAYRQPAARIELMNEQNIEGCFLFPTLGVGLEEALLGDPEAAHATFEAFNRWVLDDWGYAYENRIFGAPYLNLQIPERAEAEVERALANRARVVVLRSGPVRGPGISRSPGDRVYDRLWARLAEAGTLVAFHSGDSGYHRYAQDWGGNPEMEAFRYDPFRAAISGHRPIHDTIAALICHGVFNRHPALRVATIESGSDWVPALARTLKKSYAQMPSAFGGADPLEQLREHVWVSPYYEDDLPALRDTIGAERILFGSDYPHAEGLADPSAFVHDLAGFSAPEIRLIMRDNGRQLAGLAT